MAALAMALVACTRQPPPCGPPLPDVPVPERARYCCLATKTAPDDFVCLTLTSTVHPCSFDWCCECEDR